MKLGRGKLRIRIGYKIVITYTILCYLDSCVILWKKSLTKDSTFGREYAEFEKETWSVVQMFQ